MKKKVLMGLCTVLTTASIVTGCGASESTSYSESTYENASYTTDAYSDSYLYDSLETEGAADYSDEYTEESAETASPEVDESNTKSSHKLITTMNLNAETFDLNALMTNIETKVDEMGGYIESSDVNMDTNSYSYYRSTGTGYYVSNTAYLTIRIPENKLDSFISDFAEQSNITYKSSSVEDVTLKYTDVETRIKSLRTEEERLLEFMEKAETIEDMMSVEDRLTEVQYELQSYEAQLRVLDNKVNYATLYLNLSEVAEYSVVEEDPRDGFLERIVDGFVDNSIAVFNGFKEVVIWLISSLPIIFVWAIFLGILALIIKRVNKKRKKNEATASGGRNINGQGSTGNPYQGGV